MKLELLSLPFIGAFIGYFTNYVAIKMLFFPRKPYYLFGIQLPFTPGLIPKKRKEIIEKISEVVSEKVVSKKEIIRYIYKKQNRKFLYEFSEKTINRLLGYKLSVLTLNKQRITEYIQRFLENNLDTLVKDRLKNVNLDIEYFVYNMLLQVDRSKPLKEFIPVEVLSSIKSLSSKMAEESLERLQETVDSREIRLLIKEKLMEAMERYADNSNILMASIVSMIAPFLEDNEKIINTIVLEMQSFLKEPRVKEITARNIYDALESQILNKSLQQTIETLTGKSIDELQRQLAFRVKEMFERLNIKEKIIDNALESMDKGSLARELSDMLFVICERYTFYDLLRVAKPDVIERLPSMVVNNLLFVIKKESERIFSFDIAKLAKERLEKLDISEIEDVVLNISRDQFTHINIFGGILGFLIGLIEILLNLI